MFHTELPLHPEGWKMVCTICEQMREQIASLTTENERLRQEIDTLNTLARGQDEAFMAVEAELDEAIARVAYLEKLCRRHGVLCADQLAANLPEATGPEKGIDQ